VYAKISTVTCIYFVAKATHKYKYILHTRYVVSISTDRTARYWHWYCRFSVRPSVRLWCCALCI